MSSTYLTDLTDNDENLKKKLLQAVPEGKVVGNVSLKNKLNIAEEEYWRIRNLLIDEGKLVTGRGKGGSVRKLINSREAIENNKENQNQEEARESDFYIPILKKIKTDWAGEERLEEGTYYAEITASQGRRLTGGKWTRPDIVLGSRKRYRYIASSLEIVTFEIKTADSFDVTAIYEALSHRRFSHKAYVLVPPGNQQKKLEDNFLEELNQEADRHGIGLITIEKDVSDWGEWTIQVKALRHEPDPEKINDFIAQQLSEGFKDWILKNRD